MTIIKAIAATALFAATSTVVFAQEGDGAKQQEVIGIIGQHPELRVDPIRVQVLDTVIYVRGRVDNQAELETLETLLAVERKSNPVEFDVDIDDAP